MAGLQSSGGAGGTGGGTDSRLIQKCKQTLSPDQLPEQTTPEQSQAPDKQPQTVTITQSAWPALVLVLALAVAVWLQYGFRRYLGRKRCQKGSTNAQALARWQYAVTLAKHLKEAPPEALQALAEKAKFSQYTIMAEELAVFAECEEIATQKLKRKNIFMQIYYRLVLALY